MKPINFCISIIYLSIVALLSQSCDNQKKEQTGTTIIEVLDVETISHLDSVFSTVTFLPLDTDDDYLITQIVNLKIQDSLIYINDDYKRLLVFDLRGKFMRQIGVRGQGPGEYLEMRDWIIDNNQIEILDYKRILTYTLDGKYLHAKSFNLMTDSIYCNAMAFTHAPLGGYYLWGGTSLSTDYSKPDRYLMYEVDDEIKIKKGYFPIKHGTGGASRQFSYYQDVTIIDPIFGDYNIYEINKKGAIEPRYFFDFGEHAYTNEISAPKSGQKAPKASTKDFDDSVTTLHNFLETDACIHMNFRFKNLNLSVLVNKTNAESYILSPNKAQKDEFRFWGALCAYNDQLVYPIDAWWFTDECKRLSPAYRKELDIEDYKTRVDESDNPVLVFYKLKK